MVLAHPPKVCLQIQPSDMSPSPALCPQLYHFPLRDSSGRPTLCRTMYGRRVYADISERDSFGEEREGSNVRAESACFRQPPTSLGRQPARNFKIQCAKYATISDIVIYCPLATIGCHALAKWVREAQATLRRERLLRGWGGLQYNVFVVTDSFNVFEQRFPSLISVDSNGFDRNRVRLCRRVSARRWERMTRATEVSRQRLSWLHG